MLLLLSWKIFSFRGNTRVILYFYIKKTNISHAPKKYLLISKWTVFVKLVLVLAKYIALQHKY